MPQYGGAYVGPIGANLNGASSGPFDVGITCLDATTTTYVPTSFAVYVGTLSPIDLSHAKFASTPYTPTQLFQYQEAAWLLGQMPSYQSQIGEIQFAIWRIFDQTLAPGPNATVENAWMTQAAAINPANFDFSSMRIYTPTNTTNQEFMSGIDAPVPIPAAAWLLGSGLIGLVLIRRRMKK